MKSFLHTVINTKKIHMDFAATTPVAKEVLNLIEPFWSKYFFNPSSSYKAGQDIKKILKEARSCCAGFFGVKESEVIFTQGGTESANLALIGFIKKIKKTVEFKPHVLVSAIEHPAVSECIEYIKTLDVDVEVIPVLESGVIDIQTFEKMLKPETVLVSIIGASNETGVIEPLHKVSSSVKKYKNSLNRVQTEFPYVYTDASQMALTQPVNVNKLGVDMMTVDGSKIYAPKMSGLLIKKNYVELEPIVYGGGQEFGLRSGTESLSSAVGVAGAISLIKQRVDKDVRYFKILKEFFVTQLMQEQILFEINGKSEILPNILNICIKGLNSDFAVIQMDEYGVQCAAMTSCAGSKGALKSDVLLAMGKNGCAGSSLRFSFGRTTTKKDIIKTVKVLKKVCRLQGVV